MELYCENFYDLTSASGEKLALRMRKNGQFVVKGANQARVNSASDVMDILKMGWERRRIAETAMNRESSR